jgi:isoleucyl-tRNA synthetase
LSKLLAPAMPFLSEEMYQNLVRSFDSSAPESVHLANWPEFDASLINEGMNRDMALVLRLVSLGHAARNKANRKVRQPLSEAAFSVGSIDERRTVADYGDLIADELNVKKVRLLDSSTEAVSHVVKPLPKQLGQKYGNKFPAIQKTVLTMDLEFVARTLMAGQSLHVVVEGQDYELLPEELEVKAMAREGFAVAEDGPYVAALVTDLTPELVNEGLAREFVRRVQDLRKQAGLDVADRIKLYVAASSGLTQAIAVHQEYITTETLTRELVFADIPESVGARAEDEFDGEKVTYVLTKVHFEK